jgi:cytosine/adenosine deaminase-related metal-dependent hydrolase
LYVAESLLAGTTALVDHHESPAFIEGSLDILADAAQELGSRLVTCFGATDRNMGEAEGERGLGECARFVRHNQRPLVRGMVGLHASFTVSDDTVRAAGELTRELGVPLHVHVAEDIADVHDAEARGHAGPLERLLALGALPPGSILAHGVHLSEEQVARAEAAELWLVQNPRSNAGNRVGYPRALVASRRVALGTDGYAADMRAERAALVEEAQAHQQPLAGDQLRARFHGGYRIVGERFGERFGAELEAGVAADIVVWPTPVDATTVGTTARHVIVAGRVVVEDGRLTGGDIDQLRAHAKDEAPRLWNRMQRY